MAESPVSPVIQTEKLVVMVNGRRASKVVHEGANARQNAEAEREQYVKRLTESNPGTTATPHVIIQSLLLG